MKGIAAISPGTARLVTDIKKPEIGDYQALVRIHACGFCNGTDMQIINNTVGGEDQVSAYPTVLGHEGCGEAVELGRKVRYLHIGDRFVRPDTASDYGKYSATFGNMSEYAVAVDRRAMLEDGFTEKDLPSENACGKIPNFISFTDGAVVLSQLECMSAVHNFGITPDMKVLIYGAGPMGLGVAAYLSALGDKNVVITDMMQERLGYAVSKYGDLKAVNTSKTALSEAVEKGSFDAVVDIVGSSKILLEGSGFLHPGGKLCSMGVLKKSDAMLNVTQLQNNTSLHMLNFPYRRLRFIGELSQLLKQGKLKLSDFYSHVLDASEIDECIRLVKSHEAMKVILRLD